MSHFISNHDFISNKAKARTVFSIPVSFQTFEHLVLITTITVQNTLYKFQYHKYFCRRHNGSVTVRYEGHSPCYTMRDGQALSYCMC